MDKEQDFVHSVIPLLKLISLTVFGLILSRPGIQLVPIATLKLLCKLVFALFLPCLIFTHLGKTITLTNFIQWWFIPANVVLSTLLGALLGFTVVKVCKPPPEFTRLTVVMTAFGNTGNLPLAIVGSVCHSAKNPFGPNCDTTGTAYVAFAQWVAVLIFYVLVYHMMEPPLEYYDIVDDEDDGDAGISEGCVDADLCRSLLVDAEWPGMDDRETEHCKTALVARVFSSNHLSEIISVTTESPLSSSSNMVSDEQEESSRQHPESPKFLQCLSEPQVLKKIRIVAEKSPISHVLQPPTLATLLALVVGMVPPVKSIVYGYDAPLSFITDSLEILSEAMVPSVMLILGGMLAEGPGPNESRLGVWTTVGVIVARLVVLPVIGIGVVWAADRMRLVVYGDKMFKFVLLLQYTTPSAILLGAVGSLRGYGAREASAVIFWQHTFAVLSLTVYMLVYFNMLSYL